jgi:hypothetical protein
LIAGHEIGCEWENGKKEELEEEQFSIRNCSQNSESKLTSGYRSFQRVPIMQSLCGDGGAHVYMHLPLIPQLH